MTRCQLVCIVIVSALLGAAGAAAAQSVANATIRGKVVDETGGALPGVTVTAASPALLVGQIAVATDSDGTYRVSELPIGDYRVTYELSGFQRHVRDEVHLTAGFTAEINVALKVGAVAETVTVSGQTPVVDTTAAAPSVNLSNQFLTEVLPVTRRIQDILATTPGMSTRFAADLGGGTSGGGGLHQLRHHRTVNDDDRRRQPRDEPRSQRAGQYGAKNAFHGAFCP